MKHKIFSVYDTKVEAHLQPIFMRTKGEAIRAITDAVNDPNHNFSRHSQDFVLFELGTFDDSNGKFELHPAPESVGVLVEFVKPK